jgi:hypothetical protein
MESSDDRFTTRLEFLDNPKREPNFLPTTQAPAAAPQLCSTRTSWFAEGPHHARGSRQIARSDRPRRKALSACRKISPQKARRPAQRSQRYWADPNSAAVLSSRRRPKAAPDLQAPEQTIDQGTRSGKPRRQSLRLRRLSLTCYCLPCLRFPDPPLARAIKTKLTGRRLHSAG